MITLEKGQEHILKHLFADCQDTLVWSYLQGYMGQGFIDSLEKPSAGRIISNDFCYLAGDTNLASEEFLKNFPENINKKDLILMPCNEEWNSFIEEKTDCLRGIRYAIKKEKDNFNEEKLCDYVSQLPPEYDMCLINHNLYKKAMSQEWSRVFCANFKNAEDFVNNGLGVVILEQGEIVAGASSFSIYQEGIEVEIVTKERYRNKGLATICGAKLILECLKRGKYPSWDAANMTSVRVAEKLGYHFDKSYTVYFLK